MKKIFLATFLILVGCATESPFTSHGKVGAVSTVVNWLPSASIPTITGNNASITLFTMTGGKVAAYGVVGEVVVSLRCDQPITLLWQTERSKGGAVFRTLNGWNAGDPIQGHPTSCTDTSAGRGLGDVVSAATDTTCEYVVAGPNTKLVAVTGSTGPSTCEVDVGLFVNTSGTTILSSVDDNICEG